MILGKRQIIKMITLTIILGLLTRGFTACPNQCICSNEGLTVDCSHQNYTDIPEDISSNVTNLNLSHNRISVLNDGSFATLVQLQTLDLSFNIIQDISNASFTGLNNLLLLYLGNNNITQLHDGTFNPLEEVTEITLANNCLFYLSENIFMQCKNMFKIFLQHNHFTESVFAALKQSWWIRHVDLSGNALTYLPYQMLKGSTELSFLELAGNSIDYIDANAFLELRSLQLVYLSNNYIRTLRREMFHPLVQVVEIDLSNNDLICDCDTTKFQDWLIMDSGGANLASPVTCYDPSTNSDIDVVNGDLSHLCEERSQTTSPIPTTCNPGQALCSESAHIWFETDISETTISFMLRYKDISNDAFVKMDCGEIGKNASISVNKRINESSILLTGLNKGTMYACCALVLLCDLYTCKNVQTLGQNPLYDCHNIAYITSLCLLLVLLIIAIIIIIILVYTHSASDNNKSNDRFASVLPGQEKSISHSSLNSNITNSDGFTSNSFISMDTNPSIRGGFNPNKGRPLPHPSSIKNRPESTYEHIPLDALDKDFDGGFINKTFTTSQNTLNGQVGNPGQSYRNTLAPGTTLSSTYLHPSQDSRFNTAGNPKKPRRFVRPKNVELTPNNRPRFDTMPALGNNQSVVPKPEKVLSISDPQISYDSGYEEPERSPPITVGSPPKGLVLPPKTKNMSELSYLGHAASHRKLSSDNDERYVRHSGDISPLNYQSSQSDSVV